MNLLHTISSAIDAAAGLLPMDDLDIGDTTMLAPPGMSDRAGKIVGVARWGGAIIAVLGLVGIGIGLLMNDRRKDNNEKASNFLWWALGITVISSAVSIASFFL